jgi:O-antigen/teichoic acid export membrane protein
MASAAEIVEAASCGAERAQATGARGRRLGEVQQGDNASQLGSLTARGGVYLGLRYGLGVLIGMGNMFVLTWWIGPHAYGVFLTAIGLTAFLASLTRSGVDTYLIRRAAPPDERMYQVANTLIVGLAGVLFVVGVAMVPLLARWYGNRDFEWPYLMLLLTVPVVGLAGPPTAKLERELRFKTVAQIELGGQTLALLVALTLAWRGFGVWAPVMGQLAWQVSGMAAALVAARFRPRFSFDKACAKEMLSFGVGYTASLRTWQLRTLVNPLLVGRFAGAEGVAYVGFAIRVAEGLGFIRIAAARLAIAALARLQENRARLRAALESALTIQVLVLGPLLCLFALTSPYIVPVAMGTRWVPSLRLYPFIATGVLVNSIFNLQASALFVVGEQWMVLKAYAAHVVLLAVGTLMLIPRFGLSGYGWAELAACAGYVFLQMGVARTIRISYGRLMLWGIAFTTPLFAPLLRVRWAWILCVPLAGAVIAWAGSPREEALDEEIGEEPLAKVSGRVQRNWRGRLLTLFWKTRQRGVGYLAALVRYHASGYWYRVSLRAKRVLRRQRSRKSAVAGIRDFTASDYNSVAAATNEQSRGGLAFFGDRIPSIVGVVPESMKWRTVAEAERVMRSQFRFRGIELEFGREIDWEACPEGNVSWRWDLNRHRHLVTLGTAYFYSGRTQYVEKLLEIWQHWIQSNPVGETAAWDQPFEVASRLRNWICAYFLLERAGIADARELTQLRDAMQAHARFLRFHLEWHWPNNHLLLEAKTLYEYCLCFGGAHRRGWERFSRWALERAVLEQILPDGVHSEVCSMYHRIVSGELCQLMLLCRRAGVPLREGVESRIRKSAEFSRALVRDDGSAAMLGDSAEEDINIRFEFAAGRTSELVHWVANEEERELFESVRTDKSSTTEVFQEGGYAVLRGGERDGGFRLIFDCGPFSRCKAPNHGHADTLSFELFAHGRPLIVDPGVYLPWGDGQEWARYFRSTAAHNSLVIDGKDQSELAEYADVRRTATVPRVEAGNWTGVRRIAACYRPYWSAAIEHRRKITDAGGGRICIRDRVTGTGSHRLEWYFHFAHEVDVVPVGADAVSLRRLRTGYELLNLQGESAFPLALKLVRGRKDPICGWVSLNSAQILPAWVACFSANIDLPCVVEFQLQIVS